MTRDQALEWILQVDAQLFESGSRSDGKQAWVVVVRAEPGAGRRKKLILGFGDSIEEATGIAERCWNEVHPGRETVH